MVSMRVHVAPAVHELIKLQQHPLICTATSNVLIITCTFYEDRVRTESHLRWCYEPIVWSKNLGLTMMVRKRLPKDAAPSGNRQ